MAADPAIELDLDGLCAQACLYLELAEKEQMGRQLRDMMEVLSKIRAIDTTGVEPDFHPGAPPVRFREDEVRPSLPLDVVFENTIHRSGSYFRVPRIAGDEPELF